jgi:cytochrome oxidase assembly protein ShyY1
MSRARTLVFGWVLAVVAIASFTSLGFWQSRRALEKQAMLDAAAQVLAARKPVALAAAADQARRHDYDWSSGEGSFDARGPLWLDNQSREGRSGVRAYRLFVPDRGAPLLIDMGWLPLPGNRVLPTIERPLGRVEVRGLLAPPPSTGLALGGGVVRQGDGWLLTRIDTAAIAPALGLSVPVAPRVLRLDPALPMGHTRDLQLLANTLPPEKHRGYALQWFALALTVLATALILTFRRPRR